MSIVVLALDVVGVAAAVAAAWFWYRSAQRRLRRVSRFEELDAADINRIVTVVNRSSLLNARAALAAAASALALAARLLLDLRLEG